jgi:hypothetical protein
LYFLKILEDPRRIEENPHIKSHPKSPCATLQSLAKFQNALEIENYFLLEILSLNLA